MVQVPSVKAATQSDRLLGFRIRAVRLASGMSQESLASAIGVTFQQVQKYENGTNRISAGRLDQIARCLAVSVDSLLSSPTAKSAQPSGLSREEVELLTAFNRIPSTRIRRDLARLALSLGAEPDEPSRDSGSSPVAW
jgi:transcriptional regulator with XRE-family HTH domain